MQGQNRRDFIKNTTKASLAALTLPILPNASPEFKIKLCGHLWVYASNYPPNWDCTPILATVFEDMAYANLDGVELMEVVLRHDDAVKNIKAHSQKHDIGVSGSSYGVGFQMSDKEQHKTIWKDLELVIPRLAEVGGETFGISVGGAGRMKTEQELDIQAEILTQAFDLCETYGIQPNLHNHTYEVENNLHDLKGTLKRISDAKLGPDLNWLIRAGVNPVDFIEEYGDKIVYLHIRDQYKNGEWTEHVGQGDTDFISIAQALNKFDFRGMAAIELAFPNDFEPENPLRDDWKKSKEFIEKTFEW